MHLSQKKSHPILLMLLFSLLAACSPAQRSPSPTAQPPVAAATRSPAPSQTTAPTATEPPTAIPPTPTTTATPAPSETPTATASPTPEAVTARTMRWVDVYAGPGEAYPVLASFAENLRFFVTGHNTSGDWLQVELSPQVSGWIAGSNIELTGDHQALTVVDLPGAPEPSPTPAPSQTAKVWALNTQGSMVVIQANDLTPNTYYILKIENDKGKLILNKGVKSDDDGEILRSNSILLTGLRVGIYTIRLYLNDILIAQSTFTIEKLN